MTVAHAIHKRFVLQVDVTCACNKPSPTAPIISPSRPPEGWMTVDRDRGYAAIEARAVYFRFEVHL